MLYELKKKQLLTNYCSQNDLNLFFKQTCVFDRYKNNVTSFPVTCSRDVTQHGGYVEFESLLDGVCDVIFVDDFKWRNYDGKRIGT
jgi:hypothetical protein